MKKNINLFTSKIILLILTGISILYYIFKLVTTNFNLNNEIDLLNTILIVIIVLLLSFSIIFNNRLGLCFITMSYVIIICYIGVNIFSYIPKENNKEQLVTCVGNDNISDNMKINITYKNDKIINLEYIYYFTDEDMDKADNLSNTFDKTYIDYDDIYSELTINNNIELKYVYNFKNIKIKNLKKLNTNLNDYIENDYISYNKFKEKNLNNYACKNRD